VEDPPDDEGGRVERELVEASSALDQAIARLNRRELQRQLKATSVAETTK
jgi:hypothetical protein